ncbi:hypothetical protein I4F81_004209 [Pyropia yezoensis]|uniref:Uncharacterized protein n=1 Tax=Pyropia yezoensis TaxID=2788 RepID=A0ACC3BVT0_PYRYE|nr:hypothetical protein I4F81_004209 [Neopyropia yezoensis]
MVATSPTSGAVAPWTVISQGSSLTYEQATGLDKLEFAQRSQGSALSRLMDDEGHVKRATAALLVALNSMSSPTAISRSAFLLHDVVGWSPVAAAAAVNTILTSQLDDAPLFAPLLRHIDASGSQDSAPSVTAAACALATGALMGTRALVKAIPKSSVFAPVLAAQEAAFCRYIATSLATHTAVHAGLGADDEVEDGKAGGNGAGDDEEEQLTPEQEHAAETAHDAAARAREEAIHRTLGALAAYMMVDEHRTTYIQTIGDLEPIARLVRPADALGGSGGGGGAGSSGGSAGLANRSSVQVVYEALLCLWLISFAAANDNVSGAMDAAAVPRRLAALLRDAAAEKTVRVALATLRNLVSRAGGGRGEQLRREMVGAGLVAILGRLSARGWADEELRSDLSSLSDALADELASMSTLDVYRSEVLSGALGWTPVHTDAAFWRTNAEALERDNRHVLRALVRLLYDQASEPVVQAVACHDLAMFIKAHPRGRAIANSLDVKGRLMQLMESPDAAVRRHALNAVQVLMIMHYDLLQRASS